LAERKYSDIFLDNKDRIIYTHTIYGRLNMKFVFPDMLNDGLKVCDTLGIKEVLISCDEDNKASSGVIKNCGGVLNDEFFSESFHEMLQMYVIKRQIDSVE